ncbi:MAG TPA: carboxypeptidase M32 [Chthoniobacterales bacterium]
MDAYSNLLARSREISLLSNTANVLMWDQETYLPPKALDFRSDQLAYLSGQIHKLTTAPEVGEWIKAAEDQGFAADSDEAANIRRWKRTFERETRVPTEFVERFEKEKTLAREQWIDARKHSDFSKFQPSLERLLGFSRQLADFWGYENDRYDALLETYETGTSAAELKAIFDKLRPQLKALYDKRQAQDRPKVELRGVFPESAQAAFNAEVAGAIGYSFETGRVDTTTHPFCTTLGPRDVRITTRYHEDVFGTSLYGVLHEAGHALYELGLPEEKFGAPCGSPISMGIHESQSRLWENQVGRSKAFWKHWYPKAFRHFPDLANYSIDEVTAAMQSVQTSFIRVEADEMTYDFHIMLRFELELALIHGDLEPAGLPSAWNELFEKSFNLKVPDDARGCLQDIHWSFGGFGYFPTYSLGNLNASQLMAAARREIPSLDASLESGEYAPLLKWLREKVHRHGQKYDPQDLMRLATGEPTNPDHHIKYLREKYL